MGKPTRAALFAIANTVPLSAAEHRGDDPLNGTCNVCGAPAPQLKLYWEHDEHDRPRGRAFVVYVGVGPDHKRCEKAVEDHPRLYEVHPGLPGCFPLLCGPCSYRRGLNCTHRDLKANGGGGLVVTMPGPRGIMCTRDGCINLNHLRVATVCKGRRTLRVVADPQQGSAA
jgi:hypothetical protein